MLITTEMRWDTPQGSGDIKLFGAYVSGLQDKFMDLAPVFEAVAHDVLEPITEEQFDTEGEWLLQEWDELAESTIKSRARRGHGPHPILTEDGTLRNSFQPGNVGHIMDVSSQRMEWGSEIPYGPYHQTGTSRMVARPILFVQDDRVIARIESILRQYGDFVIQSGGEGVEFAPTE